MHNRIQEIAEKRRMSLAEVARRVGMQGHAFRRYSRNEAQPAKELALRICGVLDCTLAELMDGEPAEGRPQAAPLGTASRKIKNGERIPIYAFAAGSLVGADTSMAEPFDFIDRPAFLPAMGDAYAVVVAGSSMEPRYYAGEVVYAIPRTIVRAGDFVVVVTGTDDDRRAVVKQFVRSDDEHVTLHQFNPDRDIKVPVAEIEQIDLVAGTSRK